MPIPRYVGERQGRRNTVDVLSAPARPVFVAKRRTASSFYDVGICVWKGANQVRAGTCHDSGYKTECPNCEGAICDGATRCEPGAKPVAGHMTND